MNSRETEKSLYGQKSLPEDSTRFENSRQKSMESSNNKIRLNPIQLSEKFDFGKSNFLGDASHRKKKRAKSNYQNFIDKIEGVEMQEEYKILSKNQLYSIS